MISVNTIYPNKIQIIGTEELAWLDGLDSRQRWEMIQKIVGFQPTAIVITKDQTVPSDLRDAVKLTLVSFDSTMRSNVSVGPPIDLLVYENNALAVRLERRIEEGDAFFGDIARHWDEGLKQAFAQTPGPDWLT